MTSTVRLTWSWVWAVLALALLIAGAAILTAIALSDRSQGEVALAMALIGVPALLGVFALGTLAAVAAHPTGARSQRLRRWLLALLGSAALVLGLISVFAGLGSAVLLAIAGGGILLFLALDVWRGRIE